MATLDELVSALKAADAAGNTEDAKVLANAIRNFQGDVELVPQPQQKKKEGLLTDVQRGIESGFSTGRTGFGALFGDAEKAAEEGAKRQEDIQRRLGGGESSLEKVKKAYAEKGLMSAAGTLAQEIPSAIAEQAPNILTTLGSARTGLAIGSAAAPFLGPAAPIAPIAGGIIGAFAPSYLQQVGGNVERQTQVQRERGEPISIDTTKAALTGIPQAGLDVASTLIPFGGKVVSKVLGPEVGQLLSKGSTEAAEKLAKETFLPSLKNLSLGTAVRGTATGIAAEVPTEVTQQMFERYQAGLDLTSPDALKEYGETAFDVALLGPLGILGRVSNKSEARQKLLEAQAVASETNQPQSVPLQLTYEGTRGVGTYIVFPDGSVAPSSEAALNKRYNLGPKPSVQNEAYASEADRLAVEKFRADEARRNSPAMQELDMIKAEADKRRAAALAKVDAKYAADSEFVKNAPVGGVFRAPTQEEIEAKKQEEAILSKESYMPFSVIGKEGVNVFAGQLSKNGKVINYIDANGEKKKVNVGDKNVIVDPTEQDILGQEAQFFDKERAKVEKSQSSLRGSNQEATNKFKQFLRKNPIEDKYADDILDDIKRTLNPSKTGYNPLSKTASKGFFAQGGNNLDELASMAHDQGFISDDEFNDPSDTGGVRAFMDKVNQVHKGRYIESNLNADKLAELEQSRNVSDTLEREIDARKEALANIPTEEEVAQQSDAGLNQYIFDNSDRYRSDIEDLQKQFGNLDQFDYTKPDGSPGNHALDEINKKYADEYLSQPKAERDINPTDKFFAEGEQLIKDMRKRLDKMGLKNVSLRLEEVLTEIRDGKPSEVSGLYHAMEKLIEVSLSSTNPLRSLNHEALHAMKQLGLFSEKEWAMLEDKANKTWMKQYNIAELYSDLDKTGQLEEAIAKAFGDYGSQPAPVKTLIGRALQFLKSLGNALRGRGFTTVDDIFERATEGKLKGEGVETKAKTMAERSSFEGISKEAQDRINKYFGKPAAKTWKEKYNDLRPNMLNRVIQGAFDEFRAIKNIDERSYMMARMSKSIDGALEGLLFHGEVQLRDDALDVKQGTTGLIKLYKELGGDIERYQIWKALNRDSRLPADKRSFQGLHGDIGELSSGKIGNKPRIEVYRRVLQEESKLNKSVLDVAKAKGLIDDEAYKRFSDDIYYIPFYKYMEENGGDVNSIQASSKLTNQHFSKALKGGEKRIGDLMENMLLNWSHILSASMKNGAAVSTLKAAEKLNGAKKVKSTYEGKDVVKVMEDGKQAYYSVSDPFLLDSISLISYMGPKSPFLNLSKSFTNMLRYGVTLSPAYKVRNLIRDSIQSAAISPLSMNIFKNVVDGFKLNHNNHPTFVSALAGGGVFELGVAHEGDQAALIKRLVQMGVDQTSILDNPEKIKNGLKLALEKYNDIGNKFENANRLALYQKLINEGKDHLYASYMSRDLMDFSMQGSWRAFKVVSQVVPFFNARLQGLYKLGRDGVTPTSRVIYNTLTGKEIDASDKVKATSFSVITSAVILASMALYMAFKDDEDFQRREDWDRDNFWWFKAGDTVYRIPKPFEIGAFGTIAERSLEQIMDDNVEGKVFAERLHSILMDTFAMNPTPQMIKPMIDLYSNKDSFSGAPIETAGMERLSKQERVTNNTSALAKAMGGISEVGAKVLTFNPDAQGFSPVQIDYAIKAYFGWLGGFVAFTSDQAVKPWSDVEKPGKSFSEAIGISSFVKEAPETQSKYMSDFYESNTRINQALADMKRYAELGEYDKLSKLMEEKGSDIGLQKVYNQVSDQLATYRKYINVVMADKNMSREDKENEIKRMRVLMSDAAKQVEDVRKALKRQ